MRYGFYDSIKELSGLAGNITDEGKSLTKTNEVLVSSSHENTSQLKDVAAAISDLNNKTKNNAENSQTAKSLANQAKKGSTEGLTKMDRMVSTMNAISKSSDEISKIIKVIDDIAFQTNLLALNAAVEAARAGTHGKGFAVVAEEVRNLAARSAKAAKETSALIEESVRQVGLGSTAATETSESLHAITGQVEEVSKLITQISSESDGQMQQFSGVARAVVQLNDAAGQNTSAASESHNAAVSLADTASKLDVLTKHFKTNEGGKVTPPAAP
jgi:methyl-accepting chemotaxis protein